MRTIDIFYQKSAWIVLIMAIATISGCKEDDPNDPDPSTPFHIQFDVNGSTVRYEDDADGYGNGPGRKTLVDGDHWGQSEFTLFSRNQSEPDYLNSSIVLEIVELFNDSPSYNMVFNVWATGSRDYGMWSDDSTNGSTVGVVFTYTDETGKVWSSGLLFGNQIGSTFEITDHKAVSDELYNAITIGSFNCKFNDGAGNQLDITNGEFKARTIQDL